VKDFVNIILIVAIIGFSGFLIIVGFIPLPKFITNNLDLKKMTDGDTIQIQGIGHYNYSTLLKTKQIIESTYGVPTKISQPIVLTSEYYIDNKIDYHKCLSHFDDNQNKILISNDVLLNSDSERDCGGVGEKCGNIVIVGKIDLSILKSVIRHEIGHNQCLSHCDNAECIMFPTIKKREKKKDFCEKCNNIFYYKPIYK
jgi:hypothetical protein